MPVLSDMQGFPEPGVNVQRDATGALRLNGPLRIAPLPNLDANVASSDGAILELQGGSNARRVQMGITQNVFEIRTVGTTTAGFGWAATIFVPVVWGSPSGGPGWHFISGTTSGGNTSAGICCTAASTLKVTAGTGANTTPGALIIGGHQVGYVAKTGNYTMTGTDHTVAGDASGGAFSLTLPTAVGTAIEYALLKIDSSGNAITVGTTSSQTISGKNSAGTYVSATTYSLAAQGDRLTVQSDGANWLIMST